MPQHTALKNTVPQQTDDPTNSLSPEANDSHLPDDDYLRMLRFYLQSNRWVEDQISADVEFEITSELQDLGNHPEDWGW
jgi:hypothetical protein